MSLYKEFELLLNNKNIDEIIEFKHHLNNNYDPIIKQYKYQKEEQRLQELYSNKAKELNSDELLELSKDIKLTKCKYLDVTEYHIKNHEYEYCIGNLITINQVYECTDRSAYASISVNHTDSFEELFSSRNINHRGIKQIYNKLNFNKVTPDQFIEYLSFDNRKMNLNIFKEYK